MIMMPVSPMTTNNFHLSLYLTFSHHHIRNLVSIINPTHSILDINQTLIDDGLVDREKIGGSNYYWSFPAKKDRLLQLDYDKTLTDIDHLKTLIHDAEIRLANAKRGRESEDTEENNRATKMTRRSELAKELTKATAELEVLKQNDPMEVMNLEKELKLVTAAAHRWTDNIFSCKDYLVKKRGMMKAEANKYLGITDAFDCEYSSHIV